jgi:hypothetical protein
MGEIRMKNQMEKQPNVENSKPIKRYGLDDWNEDIANPDSQLIKDAIAAYNAKTLKNK